MKALYDFNTLDKSGAYTYGNIEFDTRRRSKRLGNATYYEDGVIQFSSFDGHPEARRAAREHFGVEVSLISEFRGVLRTADGRKLTKNSIQNTTLLYDREHKMVVSGDRGVTYFSENHHPVGEDSIVVRTHDKKKDAAYREILEPIVAMFVLDEMRTDRLKSVSFDVAISFRDVISTGALNATIGNELRKIIRRGGTADAAIKEIISKYGYDRETFKYFEGELP